MKRRLFKTLVALLAMAATAAGPVRGQNSNVSWVLTPYGDLQTGDTVVIVDKTSERAMSNNDGISSAPSAVVIGLSGDQNALTEVPDATLKWVVVLNNGNYQFRKPGTDDEYLYCTNSNNGVRVGTTSANQFTFQNGGPNDVPFLKNTSNNRYLGVYDNLNWRCYTTTSANISNTVTGFYVRTVAVPPTPHTVRFASGNDGWTVTDVDSARSATAPAVLQNVMAGDSLVVTAPATLPGKVKSVKAVKYVPPAATVTTDPTATAAYIEVGSTAALVNAGTANGGTMMYAVTTTNAQPASTADFSATRPTAQGRTAGTYYVWFYAKADADHSDSEIAGPVSVTLAVMTTVTWNSTNVFNSAHMDDQLDKWHTNPLTYEGITISFSGTGTASSFYVYDEDDQTGRLRCFGNNGDSYTFTAPSGKMFCKIEIIDNSGISFSNNYGDWTKDVIHKKIVWSGTAANAVTLGTVTTVANYLNSIVFKLIDAQ